MRLKQLNDDALVLVSAFLSPCDLISFVAALYGALWVNGGQTFATIPCGVQGDLSRIIVKRMILRELQCLASHSLYHAVFYDAVVAFVDWSPFSTLPLKHMPMPLVKYTWGCTSGGMIEANVETFDDQITKLIASHTSRNLPMGCLFLYGITQNIQQQCYTLSPKPILQRMIPVVPLHLLRYTTLPSRCASKVGKN